MWDDNTISGGLFLMNEEIYLWVIYCRLLLVHCCSSLVQSYLSPTTSRQSWRMGGMGEFSFECHCHCVIVYNRKVLYVVLWFPVTLKTSLSLCSLWQWLLLLALDKSLALGSVISMSFFTSWQDKKCWLDGDIRFRVLWVHLRHTYWTLPLPNTHTKHLTAPYCPAWTWAELVEWIWMIKCITNKWVPLTQWM